MGRNAVARVSTFLRKATMKKHLLALAILSAFNAAHAQSSVTLYGVADAAIERVKGATGVTRLSSGQQQGSRWGLRGTEDLGGGMNAQFVLEAGINLDAGTAGQSGRAFGRQSFVGLGGGFGTVRLGRQYSPMDDVASIAGTKVYDVLSVVPILGNGDYNRVDNAINYLSPNFGGFSFQVQRSLGNEGATAGSPDFQKQTSANLMYSGGPLTLALGLQSVDDNSAAAGDQDADEVLLAGSYAFGDFKVTAYHANTDLGTNDDMKVTGIGGAYTFGANTVSAAIAKARDVRGIADDDASIFTLQGSHNLSKRTALYAHYTRVSNDGFANLGFNAPTPGGSSTGIQFGVRHRF